MKALFKRFFRPFFAMLIILLTIMSLIAICRFLGLALLNREFDSTPISNIGFVVMIGLSSVTFTWAKTFETKTPSIFESLNRDAAGGIIAALCFIIGSLFKYLWLKSEVLHLYPMLNREVDNILYIIGGIVANALAGYYTTNLLFSIFWVFFNKRRYN
ncbi:hypothetical protein [Mucilaginibacter gynuensis]|uniref:hypothetical protein n=1 Tax=Mucilaginibacter gynuensis TaxID=1302236 RepID=UPI0031E9065E